MKNKNTIYALIIILILIGVIYITFRGDTSPGEYDALAECLTEKGFKIYGAYWCPHCIDQKEAFGNSFKKINYIECSLPNNAGQTEICKQALIMSYPTWELPNGTRIGGVISFGRLSELSGCAL